MTNRTFSHQAGIACSALLVALCVACQPKAAPHATATPSRAVIDTLMNAWHRAAARADAEQFFGAMTENSVYLGTDASERWSKTRFYAFAKPHFDRGKAWNFTPYNREVLFANDSLAYFDELLRTWMGVCRGSGVVMQQPDGKWKIAHYNLAVTIHNDLITDFVTLIKRDTANNSFLKDLKR